eukprot:5953679-Alexandrium_andersonii.AAC.1
METPPSVRARASLVTVPRWGRRPRGRGGAPRYKRQAAPSYPLGIPLDPCVACVHMCACLRVMCVVACVHVSARV